MLRDRAELHLVVSSSEDVKHKVKTVNFGEYRPTDANGAVLTRWIVALKT